jgi:outer membrane protein TolC
MSKRRIAASNARIGQALAEYYPRLSLSGFLGNEAISPGNLFREKGFQPSAVAGLRWRLFDFGSHHQALRRMGIPERAATTVLIRRSNLCQIGIDNATTQAQTR